MGHAHLMMQMQLQRQHGLLPDQWIDYLQDGGAVVVRPVSEMTQPPVAPRYKSANPNISSKASQGCSIDRHVSIERASSGKVEVKSSQEI